MAQGTGSEAIELSLCFDFNPRNRVSQIFRFSLYGFLDDIRFYNPFWLLFFRAKGLSFGQYGLMMSMNEALQNLWQVPAGFVADGCGRRRTLVLAFLLHVAAFLGFTFSGSFEGLLLSFIPFAAGKAFQSGTHKSLIAEWLHINDRQSMKVQVLGYCSSWSRVGAAISSLAAGGVVAVSGYQYMFAMSCAPYALNIVNILSYPVELDGEQVAKSLAARAGGLLSAVRGAFSSAEVRSMMMESALFAGVFQSGKDFLQVLVQSQIAVRIAGAENQAWLTALLLGVVYWISFLICAVSARQAHRLVSRFPSEEQAARYVWSLQAGVYATLGIALVADFAIVATLCFFALDAMQNVWKPLIVSRVSSCTDKSVTATILSAQQQLMSMGKVFSGPILGYAIDRTIGASITGTATLVPFPCLGFVASLGIFCCYWSKPSTSLSEALLVS